VADPVVEDGLESDEAPGKVRKCCAKRMEEWKFQVLWICFTEMNETHETGQEALTTILKRRSGLRKR
jgi:hypothetical protein